jgi:hypothetical protein
MFYGASHVKLFEKYSFGIKQLQTTHEAAREAVPDGAKANRPWADLLIHWPCNAQAMFEVVVETVIGNGESENTRF